MKRELTEASWANTVAFNAIPILHCRERGLTLRGRWNVKSCDRKISHSTFIHKHNLLLSFPTRQQKFFFFFFSRQQNLWLLFLNFTYSKPNHQNQAHPSLANPYWSRFQVKTKQLLKVRWDCDCRWLGFVDLEHGWNQLGSFGFWKLKEKTESKTQKNQAITWSYGYHHSPDRSCPFCAN